MVATKAATLNLIGKISIYSFIGLATSGVSTCNQNESTSDQPTDGAQSTSTDEEVTDSSSGASGGFDSGTTALPDCLSDGQVDCIIRRSSDFKAVKATALLAEQIRSGVTIAGIAGNLAECTQDGSTACVANSDYRAAMVNGLAGKVLSGSTVAGIEGTSLPPPVQVTTVTVNGAGTTTPVPNCASDGAVGCVTVSAYPAAKLANFANTAVRAGTTIAGVVGSLQNCATDGQVGCVTSSSMRAAAIAGLSAWNIRHGTSIAGVSGLLKANCRNSADLSKYNYDGAIASLTNSAVISGSLADIWDTIDDYYGFPSAKVNSWSTSTYCDPSIWLNTTTLDGGATFVPCGTSSVCIAKDMMSNLEVTGILSSSGNTTSTVSPGQFPWNIAINKCAASTYGGYTAGTWRLPTQKEMLNLYLHGIAGIAGYNFMNQAHMTNNMWTSTSWSLIGSSAWAVTVGYGTAGLQSKTTSLPIFCVR